MKKVDYETHLSTKPYIEAMSKIAPPPPVKKNQMPGRDIFGMSLAERVAIMDEFEVATQLVSCAGGLEKMDVATATRVAKLANDEFADMAAKYPGRFLGYATLIPQDIEASLLELERCKRDLGFPAWNTHTNFTNRYIDEDEFFPLLEKAAELDMFVYLHPGPPSIERLNGLGGLLSGGLGYHVDGAITLTRLICKGVFDRLPNLKMFLGHYGEALPFMMDRMDSMAKQDELNSLVGGSGAVNQHTMDYYFKHNIFVTTSGNFSRAAFNCTKERLGIDRILFGTDFPIETYEQTCEFLDHMDMTEEEREALFWRNSQNHFGI